MSPLIINSKNGIVTIGSPGADRISSSLALVINNYTKNNNWQLSINEPRYHVNMDGTVRSEPGVKVNLKNTTTTEANDMYYVHVNAKFKYLLVFDYSLMLVGLFVFDYYMLHTQCRIN